MELNLNFLSFFVLLWKQKTIQYYSENGGKHVHLLLLDNRKVFDKVAYDNMLF